MMTDDQDPMLQTLFANAEQDLPGEPFNAQVMAKIGKWRRRAVYVRICVGFVFVLFAALLATPLQEAVNLLIQGLSVSLISLDDVLFAQLLSPVNNVGCLVVLCLIGLRSAFRRLFS